MDIVNIAVMNISVQIYVLVPVFHYFEFILRSETPKPYEMLCLNSTFQEMDKLLVSEPFYAYNFF